jgi:hypothetical protein
MPSMTRSRTEIPFLEKAGAIGNSPGSIVVCSSMSKLTWAVVLTVLIAFLVDQYFNQGHHTDGLIRTLSDIKRAFGW